MIEVIAPGLYSSVQDLGRVEGVSLGVPISGAMDSIAARLANSILCNDTKDAVLEITMTGPKLKFTSDTTICITGADMKPLLDGKAIAMSKKIVVKTNSILEFGRLQNGFRSYLAVSGGFRTENILNSRSWYEGITKSFRLKSKDVLPIQSKAIDKIVDNGIRSVNNSNYINETVLKVFKGPEFNLLPINLQDKIWNTEFTISKNNSRMAYQLEELIDNKLEQIITAPVMPGTVQLTPSGKIIILMRDCQTTGGYPRIIQLPDKAISIISQKFVGKKIRFQLTED